MTKGKYREIDGLERQRRHNTKWVIRVYTHSWLFSAFNIYFIKIISLIYYHNTYSKIPFHLSSLYLYIHFFTSLCLRYSYLCFSTLLYLFFSSALFLNFLSCHIFLSSILFAYFSCYFNRKRNALTIIFFVCNIICKVKSNRMKE